MFGRGSDGRARARVKRVLKLAGLGAVVVGVGIQFIPVKEIGTQSARALRARCAARSRSDLETRLFRLPHERNTVACLQSHRSGLLVDGPRHSQGSHPSQLLRVEQCRRRRATGRSADLLGAGGVRRDAALVLRLPDASRGEAVGERQERNSRATSFAMPRRRSRRGPRTFQRGNRITRREQRLPSNADAANCAGSLTRTDFLRRAPAIAARRARDRSQQCHRQTPPEPPPLIHGVRS